MGKKKYQLIEGDTTPLSFGEVMREAVRCPRCYNTEFQAAVDKNKIIMKFVPVKDSERKTIKLVYQDLYVAPLGDVYCSKCGEVINLEDVEW